MSTISISLKDIYDLAKKTLLANGCDDETSNIMSDLIVNAEDFSDKLVGQINRNEKSAQINFPIDDEVGKAFSTILEKLAITYMKNVTKNLHIDDSLLNKFAPKIVEGTKRLKAWVEST